MDDFFNIWKFPEQTQNLSEWIYFKIQHPQISSIQQVICISYILDLITNTNSRGGITWNGEYFSWKPQYKTSSSFQYTFNACLRRSFVCVLNYVARIKMNTFVFVKNTKTSNAISFHPLVFNAHYLFLFCTFSACSIAPYTYIPLEYMKLSRDCVHVYMYTVVLMLFLYAFDICFKNFNPTVVS